MGRRKGSKNKRNIFKVAAEKISKEHDVVVEYIAGEVWKKWHHECDWFYKNIETQVEHKICQNDANAEQAIREFEQGKVLLYD